MKGREDTTETAVATRLHERVRAAVSGLRRAAASGAEARSEARIAHAPRKRNADETSPAGATTASFAPTNSARVFGDLVSLAGFGVVSLTASQAVDMMTDFYKSAGANGCPLEEDGDMLLYRGAPLIGAQGHLSNST